ncbi:Malonyl-[acyl-carrier protein] O-methyltransferase [Halioglobus japonicus]|nr:Malonyl-[acyl-carrier protein] O-methyltransferase [Halioglobus japonicus]
MPLHYEYLPATGTPQQELVLLHGWGCNLEVWRPLLVLLRPWANITVLDIPGVAPGCDATAGPDLADLIANILDSCPAQAVYVGWSLGGLLATELAHQNPERASAVITLCSNPMFVAGPGWPGMDAAVFADFAHGVKEHPGAALKRFDTLQVTGARQPRALLRQLQSLGRGSATGEMLAGLAWLQALDMREILPVLQQPQLHLLAAGDALVSPDVAPCIAALAAEKPVPVEVLPGACHLAPLDIPELLARKIRGFLDATGVLQECQGRAPDWEKAAVAASFSRAASGYDSVAQLQRNVGEHLLSCLDEAPDTAGTVLDLGCGTGYFCAPLRARYPKAQYLGLDLASGMVDYARKRCEPGGEWLVADAESLPLASESIDLVFSSLTVQWCARPEHLLAELSRILRPGGLCVFTSLGPDTLSELRAAWATVDEHQHVNTFLPGADLLAAAERLPGTVLSLQEQIYCMEYTRVRDLLDELKTLGAHNMNRSRPAGLTPRRALQGMLQAYETKRSNGVLPATYEVIFGVLKKL